MSYSKRVAGLVGAAIGIGGVYYAYTASQSSKLPAPKAFTDPNVWVDLKLKSFKDVSEDAREFTFALESPEYVSGLQTASLLMAKYVTAKGNNVIRPYTPVSDPDHKGEINFVIKKYPNSKFGTHIFGLKPDDTVSFKGPIQKWKWTPNSYEDVVLIGGGSGITPLYQLLTTIAKNPADKTKVHLIYGNKTKEDILLKGEIDDLAKKYPEQVKVDYFLDKADSSWTGKTGFVNRDFLSATLPKPGSKTQVFVCGPDPLYKAVSGNKASKTDQGEVTGYLADLGYTKSNVFKF